MLKYEPFLFKLYSSFQYVNSRAEIPARAEISPCNQPLRDVGTTGAEGTSAAIAICILKFLGAGYRCINNQEKTNAKPCLTSLFIRD